eukprot:9087107-Prorocentrum_lima.AAC.1
MAQDHKRAPERGCEKVTSLHSFFPAPLGTSTMASAAASGSHDNAIAYGRAHDDVRHDIKSMSPTRTED